jgi:hypothetical protein
MCDDGTGACLGSTPQSLAPVDGENFYWIATAEMSSPGLDVSIEFAAEAAWLGPTDPITFDRLRIRGHADAAGDYVVTHPYGTTTVTVDDAAATRNINFTDDVGCAGSPCDFTEMTSSPNAHITDWIISDSAPAGRVGDGVTADTATVNGVPASVSVTGPAGSAATNEFVVMGKIAPANDLSAPAAVDFGNVAKAVTKTVRLRNLGTQPRTITKATLSASTTISKLASSTCTPGRVLAVGGTCTVDLRYKPNGTKQSNETLTITSPQGNKAVRVTAQTAAVAAAPAQLRFDAVRAGGSGKTRRVVVSNKGSIPLQIGRVRLAGKNPGSFDIRTGAPKVCVRGATVRPGGECAVYLGFEPKGFGPKRASLKIASNALGGVHTTALSGSGR